MSHAGRGSPERCRRETLHHTADLRRPARIRNYTAAFLAAVLGATPLACGAIDEAEGPTAELALALDAGTAARLTSLHVAFLKTALDCSAETGARSKCLKELGVTAQPLLGADAGRTIHVQPFDGANPGQQPFDLQVAPDTYLVLVEGLDVDGRLIANGCALQVKLKSGETTSVSIPLDPFVGPTCFPSQP